MKRLLHSILFVLAILLPVSCIEDGIDTSPTSQPVFSTDTLNIGTVFTDQPTPTSRFMVYNRHDKILNISNISLRSGGNTFRINVDGFAGTSFQNIEIRPNDSIYVFVEATLAQNGSPSLTAVEDILDFVTNGVTTSVVLHADGQDVTRLRGEIINSDRRLTADYPYQIYDSLVVAPEAVLTIAPGTILHFHDKAYMRVYGSLVTEGTSEEPVVMRGDRTGSVVSDISFDLMDSQWDGLHFAPSSRGNRLSHTEVRNTVSGVIADSLSEVRFHNCRLRNSATYSLSTRYADLTLTGCEVAEASDGALSLTGGKAIVNHCTFANYYLFSALHGAIVQIYHFDAESDNGSGMPYLVADFSNSILYGNGTDWSVGNLDGTAVTLRRCLLKSSGSDDANFIDCVWDSDPLYYTVREEYLFDYRLQPGSPAIGSADPQLTLPEAARDIYGCERLPSPNLGAYQAMKEQPDGSQVQ